MKKKYLSILLLGTLLLHFGIGKAENPDQKLDSIFEIQDYVEKTLNIKSSTISSRNDFPLIKEILEKKCPAESIDEAQNTLEQTLPTRQELISQISPNRIKYEFEKIKTSTLQIQTENPTEFCKIKYISYTFLEMMRNQNLSHYQNEQEHPAANPKQSERENSASQNQQPTIEVQNNTKNLSWEDLTFAEQTKQLAHEELTNLLSLGILNPHDQETLNNHIEINYLPWCKKTHGSFHILQNKTTKEKKFKTLKLNIAICNTPEYQANYRAYFKQILAHELGHYIYFFRDQDHQAFDTICRNNEQNTCNAKGFFSEYAQKSKEEDYAESFAYRYKNLEKEKEFWSAPTSEAIYQKENPFNQLFASH